MVVTAIGFFFHVYVLLALLNGVLWLLITIGWRSAKRTAVQFSISALVLGVIALTGYTYFGERQRFTMNVFEYVSPFEGIAQGWGWIALPYGTGGPWRYAWGFLCSVLAIIGIIHAWRRRLPCVRELIISLVLQTALIMLADVFSRYLFAPRQLVHLLPVSVFFSALGITASIDWIMQRSRFVSARIATALLVAIMLLASVPALQAYYVWPKSQARTISVEISRRWKPGDTFVVAPGWTIAYRYYLQTRLNRPDIWNAITPVARADLLPTLIAANNSNAGAIYVSITGPVSQTERGALTDLGFRAAPANQSASSRMELLFVREQTSASRHRNGPPGYAHE